MEDAPSDILSKLDVLEKSIQELRSEVVKSNQDIRSELTKTNKDVQDLAMAQKSTQQEIMHVICAAEIVTKLGDNTILPITKPKTITESPKPQPKPVINVESQESRFLDKYLKNVSVNSPAGNIRNYFAIICAKVGIDTLKDNANNKEIEEHGTVIYNHIMSATEERYNPLKDFIMKISA